MNNYIYFDNSCLARPSEKTISRMLPLLTDLWGNPAAPHQKGQELLPALKESYNLLYQLLGAKEEDTVLFTSSGAEAVNQVFASAYYDVVLKTGKNQFIVSSLDEAPAIMAAGRFEEMHCVTKMAQANKDGIISPETVADLISPRTALISLSWASGLTGVIQPVAEIAELSKERGILLHLDATHVLGKLYFEAEDVGADFISFNGDQLHAPKGTGGLYIKADTKCSPLIIGGSDQGGMRAGSLNVPGLAALASAAQESLETRDLIGSETARLREHLERGIELKTPGAIPLFRDQERVPHCSAISFPGVSNEALLYHLNRKGVYASIGGGEAQQIDLFLQAAGIKQSLAQSAISFSLSRYTTEEEVERAIEIISDSVEHLRKISKLLEPV